MEYTEENYKNAQKNDMFEFVCQKCGKTFTKTKREIQRNGGKPFKCCSLMCGRTIGDLGKIEVVCAECGKKKLIKVSEYNRSENKIFFCNSSCAAKYNNRLYPKRQKLSNRYCPICGGLKDGESKLCKKCSDNESRTTKDKMLGDYIGYGEKREKYISSKCQSIRRDAKRTLMEDTTREKVCEYCKNHEFDEILEVHHIKPIADFDEHTKISEINSLDNLVWLCPNHHTMLEKRLISLI
jgi:5-methylcytosine-specific restriction endonuclease McrA